MAENIHSDIIINVDTSVGIAEIKNLQKQISALNTQLMQSGAAQAKAAQNIQRNLINNINATGQFAARVKTIASTTETFTERLERNKMGMGELFKYAGGATKTFGRLFKSEFDTIEKVARERVKTIQTQYIKLGRDAGGALKAISVRPLALDMENLATKTAIAAQKQQLFNQLLKQGSTNLLNFGKNTQWAGRQLMVGFTIPLAYLGTAAAKTFMKMEEQAIRFKRVYGDSFTATAETDKMIKQVQQLANEFTKYGVAVEKTMEMAANAAAMGKQGADLIAQVQQATTLAVLGGVDQEKALETTISLTNAFGIAAEDLAGKIDFLNAVENQTVTSIEDLTTAIPKAGPVIQQLGGDVEDLAFFLTAMREGGINASEGANALKSGLASLINPTDKASEMLGKMGINIKGIVEANKGDIKNTVIGFAQALDTLDPLNRARAIEQLFGKFQFARLSTLFQNVVKEGTQASRVAELTRATTEELAILSEREMKRIEESPMYKFKKAVEDLKVSLVPLGEAFLKAVTPIIDFAKGFLDKFNEMGDGAKQFAVIATTVIAGLGPVALMTFGLLANGVANIMKLFTSIRNIFLKAGDSSRTLGSQTEYMTQQQLEAAAVAASLDQNHSKLIQTFTSETAAVNKLADSYARAIIAQSKLIGVPVAGKAAKVARRSVGGSISGPGTSTSDSIPALLSDGEYVIKASTVDKVGVGALDHLNQTGSFTKFSEGGQAVHRSHLQEKLNLKDPKVLEQLRKNVPGFDKIPKDILQRMSFHGSLTADLSSSFNERLKAQKGGLPVNLFTEGWNNSKDKLLSTAISGGLNPRDVSQIKILNILEEKIGKEAVRLASPGNVTDQILSKATSSVLKQAVRQRGMTGNVASILQNRSLKLGDYRSTYTKAEFGQMLSSGKVAIRGSYIIEPNSGAILGRVSQSRGFKQTTKGINGGYTRQPKLGTPWGVKMQGLPKIPKTQAAKFAAAGVSSGSKTYSLKALLQQIALRRASGGIVTNSMMKRMLPGFKKGVVSVPGPKGAGDVTPAMLTPGEAVISAPMSKKYSGLISAMINDTVPGYNNSYDPFGPPPAKIDRGTPPPPIPGVGQKPMFFAPEPKTYVDKFKRAANKAGVALTSSAAGKVATVYVKKAGDALGPAAKKAGNSIAGNIQASILRQIGSRDPNSYTELRGGKIFDNSSGTTYKNKAAFDAAQNEIKAARAAGSSYVTPTGQTYRYDENGKAVRLSKQELANRNKGAGTKVPFMERTAGKAMVGIGGAASMGGMAMMMSGDQSGIGNALMMGGMALSMLPMLMNPVGAVVAGLAAVVGGIFLFNKALEDGSKKGYEFGRAMSMTNDKLVEMSEFTGRVTATESRKKKDEMFMSSSGAVGRKFGMNYVESESGKAILADIDAMKKKKTMSDAEIGKTVGKNLAYAVVQGAITEEEARSIAMGIGNKLKNYEIASNISANVVSILGPKGEDLAKEPLKVTLELQAESEKQLNKQFTNAQSGQVNPTMEGVTAAAGIAAATVGATSIGMTAAGALAATGAANFWNPAGWALLAAGIGVATYELFKYAEIQAKNNELNAAAISMAATQLQQNQGLLDSLNAQYDKKIKAKEAEIAATSSVEKRKKLEQELNTLIRQRDTDTTKLKNTNANMYQNMVNQANAMGKENFDNAFKMNADNVYKDTPLAAFGKAAKDEIDTLDESLNVTREFQIGLSLAFLSKEMDPGTITFLAQAAKEDKSVSLNYDLIVKQRGTAENAKLATLLAGSGINQKNFALTYDFFANIKDPAIWNDSMAALKAITDMNGKYGVQIDLNTNGQQKIERVQKAITALNKLPKKITKQTDLSTLGLTPDELNTIKNNWALFADADGTIKKQIIIDYVAANDPNSVLKAWAADQNIDLSKITNGQSSMSLDWAKATSQKWLIDYIKKQNTPAKPPTTTPDDSTGTGTDPIDELLNKLKMVRDASIKATGGLITLRKVLGAGGKDAFKMDYFSGIEQNLLGAGQVSSQFMQFYDGLDEKAKKTYVTISGAGKNAVAKLTEDGRLLQQALNKISLGELQSSYLEQAKSAEYAKIATTSLMQAGLDYADALDVASDSAIAFAIATAKNEEEVINLVNAFKKFKNAQTDVEKFGEAYNKAKEAWSAKENEIDIKFRADTKSFQDVVTSAENEIAKLTNEAGGLDDLQAGLTQIGYKEDEINNRYDDRVQALDKIAEANRKISEQQKGQLSLADALSKGDLSAAASAIQSMRAQSITSSIDSQRSALQSAREAELDALTVDVNGKKLTRKQIEAQILEINKKILEIEEKRLEPANEAIRLKEVEKATALSSLEAQKLEWEKLQNKIDLAKTSAWSYVDALKEAAGLAAGAVKEVTPGDTKSSVEKPATLPTGSETLAGQEVAQKLAALTKTGNQTTYNDPYQQTYAGKQIPAPEISKSVLLAFGKSKNTGLDKDDVSGGTVYRMIQYYEKKAKEFAPGPAKEMYENRVARGLLVLNDQYNAQYKSVGGMIKPAYFSFGGRARGTDTVPAMLTPGEFVVKKYAVDSFGVDNLKAINNGTYDGNSVYNYNLSVNMSGSNLNPNDVARVVMNEIRRVESQGIRRIS